MFNFMFSLSAESASPGRHLARAAIAAFSVIGTLDSAPVLAAAGDPLTPEIAVASIAQSGLNLVARDAAGDFAVAWQEGRAPYSVGIRLFSANGNPLTNAVALPSNLYQEGLASIGMDDAGDLAVLWNCTDSTTFNPAYCMQTYTLMGSPISPVVKVFEQSRDRVGGLSGPSARLGMSATGDVVVVWSETMVYGSNTVIANRVRVLSRRYRLDGTAYSQDPTVVFSRTYPSIAGYGLGPGLRGFAMSRSGDYAILANVNGAMSGKRQPLQARFFDATGSAVSGVVTIPGGTLATLTASNTYASSLSMTAAGDWVIALGVNEASVSSTETYALYTLRYAAAGTLKKGPIRVAASPKATIGLSASGLNALQNDGYSLSYGNNTSATDASSYGVLTAVFDANDQVQGSPFPVATGAEFVDGDTYAAVTDADDRLIAAWGSVRARVFSLH